MTENMLNGHESCDYSTYDTIEINEAIAALDKYLTSVRPVVPHASIELNHLIEIEGEESRMVQMAGRLLATLLRDMMEAQEARDCLMREIMNRAHADNDAWQALQPCACGSKLPEWECELLKSHTM